MTHTEEANRKWLRWNPGDADMRSGKNLFFVTGRCFEKGVFIFGCGYG